jgi:uncharacterized protein (TIGR02452 family)
MEVLIVKPYIIAFCSVILLASAGFSQSPAEKYLFEKLDEGPDQAKALETVLKAPDQFSAVILYLGARAALKEKRLGGGFLGGARAQEEAICRSSALYHTLVGDPMYEEHSKRPRPAATDWTIYSPDVPIFRSDDGTELENPWLLSFITCAAPYAPAIGQPEAGDLLQRRIHRALAIARAYRYSALILGAWGCGAFGNDTHRTAADFRQALENEFSGAFSDVVFAIADWSPERKFLGPFRKVFTS